MANDILQHSVTRDEHKNDPSGSIGFTNFLNIAVPGAGYASLIAALPPTPPPFWSFQRDYVLSRAHKYEGRWAAAINTAAAIQLASNFDIDSPSGLTTARTQEMLHGSELGQGWIPFLSKCLRDYLTTDNGFFVEIVRAAKGPSAKILGLVHLDSRRCMRTGDPAQPVVYRDRFNDLHTLKDYQVFCLSDSPDPADGWNGVGECAATRAYVKIVRMAYIEQYQWQKLTGSQANVLDFISGVTADQIKAAVNSTEVAQGERERVANPYTNVTSPYGGARTVAYKGSIIIPFIDHEGLEHVRIDLAGLPDNFDYDAEEKSAYLFYANCIGIDPQDLVPIGGQALGVGAQSAVLAAKARGKGLAVFRAALAYLINTYVLPAKVMFSWSERSLEDEQAEAAVAGAHINNTVSLVGGGIVSQAQGIQLLVDSGDLPDEFLPNDMTPDTTLSSDEKPLADVRPANPVTIATPAPTTNLATPQPPQAQQQKEAATLDSLLTRIEVMRSGITV